MLSLDQARPLIDFANERHAIYMRKAWLQELETNPGAKMSSKMAAAWNAPDVLADTGHGPMPALGRPLGWSLDYLTHSSILRLFRFCNVYRELDRVTVWIKDNIREPFHDHEHLWFMLAAARYINWPPVLEMLINSTRAAWPHQDGFRPEFMTQALEAWRATGKKTETGAYMIRAESDTKAPWYSWSKQRYVSEVVLGKLWDQRDDWAAYLTTDDPQNQKLMLRDVWERFQDKHYTGWGPFMAYQVVVDLRWTRYLISAPDIQTWAALGPGSRRGLNRLHGRDVTAPLSQEKGLDEMLELREIVNANLAPWMHPIDLSDIQNCLCETDKLLRVRNGEGRPRAKYVPGRGY